MTLLISRTSCIYDVFHDFNVPAFYSNLKNLSSHPSTNPPQGKNGQKPYNLLTMMRITILTVSKLKKGPFHELEEKYLKQLSPYSQINVVSIKESTFRSADDRPRVLKEEAERIRSAVPKEALPILLTEFAPTHSSEQFAKQLLDWSEQETKHLCFIIGGPLGIDPYFLEEMRASLSLSPLTFPHELAYIMLLEQLYRASTILSGKTYHY